MFFDKILDALKVENLFPKELNEKLPDTSTFISSEPQPHYLRRQQPLKKFHQKAYHHMSQTEF